MGIRDSIMDEMLFKLGFRRDGVEGGFLGRGNYMGVKISFSLSLFFGFFVV